MRRQGGCPASLKYRRNVSQKQTERPKKKIEFTERSVVISKFFSWLFGGRGVWGGCASPVLPRRCGLGSASVCVAENGETA